MLSLIPKRNFLIISPARSGSTALRYALDNHPTVACHGELFGELNIDDERISNKIINPQLGVYHRTVKAQDFLTQMFSNDDYIFGSKWLYKHIFDVDNLQFIETFIEYKPKIIFLWRRNLVQRLYSDILLRCKMGYIKQQFINNIDINVVRHDCEKQILQAQYISKLLYPLDFMPLDFEDMVSDGFLLNNISSYIGVKTSKSGPLFLEKDLRSKQSKQDDMSEHLKDKFYSFFVELEEYCNRPHPISN